MITLLSMAFVLIVELDIEPSKTEEFLAFVGQEISVSRSFDGNQQFDIIVDPNEPGKIIFYEEWDSLEAQQLYWQWREAQGDKEKLQQYLLSQPIFRSFEKVM